MDRETAASWDAGDPLGEFRNRFVCHDDVLYLDGNSLGRLPRATVRQLTRVVTEEWGRGLVRSWVDWIDWGARTGDLLGTRILGARPGEVVLSDSTSVNLYKLASAVLAATPGTIIYDAADFPTNRYLVQGIAEQYGVSCRPMSDVAELESIMDDSVALIVLSLVDFRTGRLLDMNAVNAMARRAGARVLWDLSHAAGLIPVDLAAAGAELAVGCTYKYLNGGPGAPGFLYVRGDLQDRFRPPIQGWYAQRNQFDMGPLFDPVAGIGRYLVGTPPILSLAAVEPGVELCIEAGVEEIRRKSVRLCRLITDLADDWFAGGPLTVASPRDAACRGGHVSLRSREAWRLSQALAGAGVVVDFRPPDCLRLAPSPLYTRFTEVWDAMSCLKDVVDRHTYENYPATPARVT
ncbi:aminotransferase class V-fold PLP-dependent enzyme [Amycolatopsis sp. RM579]|uniref:Kynureninase n=1 Tax=Amycolatopsis pithecellobii TaxID=664692 RepID=A0A6N7YK98_9PSEU|nr:aminotransferase class V-fold PLP-dependent enzyme [Amycolatopsis pithecellobii]